MLNEGNVCATVAVKDLEAAKKFYTDKLGLAQMDGDDPGGVMFKSGDSKLFVYESSFAGTNKATGASWNVKNVEEVVENLKAKGVKFEQYDLPGVTRNGDIHVMGKMKAAWFTDPDGNILVVESHE